MHRNTVYPILVILLGAGLTGSAFAGCVLASIKNCCDAVGLNMTRKCGAFNDQDCPDEIMSNPAYWKSTPVMNGSHPGTPGSSVLCEYKTGRCRGTWGNNLCEMSAPKTHECVNQPAGAAGCTTPSGVQ